MNELSTTPRRFGRRSQTITGTAGQDRILDPRPRRRRRRLVAAGAGLLVAGLVLYGLPTVGRIFSSQHSVPRAQLRIAPVTQGTLVRDIGVQGSIVAATSPTLYSPVDGTVHLEVHAGQEVNQGQVLAVIESHELTNALSEEKSSLETSRIALERQKISSRRSRLRHQQAVDIARLDLQAAERELRRATDSHEHEVISEHDFEEAVDSREAAQFGYQQAIEQAALEQDALAFELTTSELALERQRLRTVELQRQVADLEVRSPVAGIVGNLAVEERQAIVRSAPIATVVDLTQLEVEVSVPESYGDDLSVGAPVEISWGGDSYPGVLLSISPEVEEARILARATFDGAPPEGIKRNQRVSTRILLEEIPGALMLPRGPFLDSGASRVAFVVDGDLAHRRTVRLGSGSVAEVQVLDGLLVGDQVILSSYAEFGDADSIYLSN